LNRGAALPNRAGVGKEDHHHDKKKTHHAQTPRGPAQKNGPKRDTSKVLSLDKKKKKIIREDIASSQKSKPNS